MTVFLYIMGALVMTQLLFQTEKNKPKNMALMITYVLTVVFWPFANFAIMVVLLYMLWKEK